jgi:hypothetical protein
VKPTVNTAIGIPFKKRFFISGIIFN